MPSLANKVVLVTGGSSGIGRASALAFAKAGAKVTVADVDVAGGEETIQLIKNSNGEGMFIRTDVSQQADVSQLIDKIVKSYNRLDCAHNNAGILGDQAFTVDCTEENWNQVMNVNLKGIWLCMKFEIPIMLRQGGGAIVNTSSVNGLRGARNRPAYVASKHGIIGLTKAAALEYAREGIRVNAVCPASVHTPMRKLITGGDPQRETRVDAAHPIGRQANPEEIAETVVWLCSDTASFTTGQAIGIDGGSMAQ